NDDEPSRAIERAMVRMRRFLLRPVRAERASERREIASRPERSVLLDRQQRHRTGSVVRHDKKASGRIDGEVDAVSAAGRLLIQHAQSAVRLIDPVRRDLRSVAVRGIEAAPLLIYD